MHEMPIASRILDIAAAAAPPGSRVIRVTLSLGALCDAEGPWLERYFRLAARGGPCEGAALAVTRARPRFACAACGASFEPGGGGEPGDPRGGAAAPRGSPGLAELRDLVLEGVSCPSCGAAGCSLSGGADYLVESIEVEEAR